MRQHLADASLQRRELFLHPIVPNILEYLKICKYYSSPTAVLCPGQMIRGEPRFSGRKYDL
jgi:hypothetical protein